MLLGEHHGAGQVEPGALHPGVPLADSTVMNLISDNLKGGSTDED